jgi:hypothetical protein
MDFRYDQISPVGSKSNYWKLLDTANQQTGLLT